MEENEHESREGGLKKTITGLGQQLIGEVEVIGGILTGDPVTRAEGEFNVEVGEAREHAEEAVESDEKA
ncbi:MAG: hypothetical protein WKF34_11810 [Pyrinomonadaceae bacterium]